MDQPTDNDLIKIRQLLVPVLMNTKYDELTLTHNLSGVILPSDRYEQIYNKGAYVIPSFIALYDDTIEKYATRIDVHCAEGNHKARRNDRQIYKTADNACRTFIMAVVDETWYKELKDPDTFYTKGHGPQAPRSPDIILRGPVHCGCGRHSAIDEIAL